MPRREIQISLALLAVEIDPLAAHRAHRRTRINGHERRDGHSAGSSFAAVMRSPGAIASGPKKGKAARTEKAPRIVPERLPRSRSRGRCLVAVVAAIAVAAMMVGERELHALLQPLRCRYWMSPASRGSRPPRARRCSRRSISLASSRSRSAVRSPIASRRSSRSICRSTLSMPHLQLTDLAPVAAGSRSGCSRTARGVRPRVILRGGGAGGGQSGAGGGEGKKQSYASRLSLTERG